MTSRMLTIILVGGVLALAAVADASGNAGPVNSYYGYDAQGRLVNVTTNGTVGSNAVNVVDNYTYDEADNRKNQVTTIH